MKIVSIRVHVVDAQRTNYVFVTIETDEGLCGVGEGTAEINERAVAAAIEDMGTTLIGENPFAVEWHVARLNRDSYWRGGVVIRSAIAALEGAMLDIKGKALGVPVYELLGGAFRDGIPVYANAWFTGARSADEFADRAKAAVAAGFGGLKWDPFGSTYGDLSAAEIAHCERVVESVRAAVGPGIDLMIEGHGRFNLPTALRLCDMLAPFEPKWFEEPLPPESLQAYASLCDKARVPIATGERYCEPSRFQDLLKVANVSYIQPDVVHVGGISALKQIASSAYSQFVPTAPHNPAGPVANAMSLHAAMATEGIVILETMMTDVPWRAQIVSETCKLVNGRMRPANVPGLGVELHADACERFPYKQHLLRHFNGSLTDIRPANATTTFS